MQCQTIYGNRSAFDLRSWASRVRELVIRALRGYLAHTEGMVESE